MRCSGWVRPWPSPAPLRLPLPLVAFQPPPSPAAVVLKPTTNPGAQTSMESVWLGVGETLGVRDGDRPWLRVRVAVTVALRVRLREWLAVKLRLAVLLGLWLWLVEPELVPEADGLELSVADPEAELDWLALWESVALWLLLWERVAVWLPLWERERLCVCVRVLVCVAVWVRLGERVVEAEREPVVLPVDV
jgi:hypothetical protein